MKISWDDTLKTWEPSKDHVRKVTDPKEIKGVIEALRYFYNQGEASLITVTKRASDCIRNDGITTWDLLELAAKQLEEHNTIWETHTNEKQSGCIFYEFPVVVKVELPVRYFKTKFVGNDFKTNDKAKKPKMTVFFHEATQTIKVVIYEQM